MASDEMIMGGILRFILRGVEKYASRRDAGHGYGLLCHKIDTAR